MLPSHRTAGRERRAFQWRTASPWTTCVRVACFSRLRFMWFTLMVLTLVCVALQMLGVVRQARTSKVLNFVSEQLVRMPAEIQGPMKRKGWEDLWSVSATVVEDPTDQHALNEDLTSFHIPVSEDERGQASKKQDTSSPERLEDTTNNIAEANKYPQTTKASVQNQLWLHQEVPKQISNLKQLKRPANLNGTAKRPGPTGAECQPKKHIVFLKTHKTASSTILNILYRYGDSHNLTFALPLNMQSQLFYPAFFATHFVEGVRTRGVKEFHILCNHMRFNSQEVRKLMPEDTFYFSILRDPTAMMESLFVYYKAIPAFRLVKSLEEFLNQGVRYFNASVPNNHYARNILTFDFGLNNTAPEKETELDRRSAEVIAAVERDFSLILISEYFDESMVLLQHALCWTLDDVLSFRLNSRSERSRRPLNPETPERVKRWNSLDWRLYQHFNATFWKHIDSKLGRTKLQQEVELLRERRRKLEETCLRDGGAVDPAQVQDSSLKPFQYGAAVIQGYNLRLGLSNETSQLCQKLITPELQYTSVLYTKQFPQLAAARAALAKKIAGLRNAASTRRAVKRNVDKLTEMNVHAVFTNNTSRVNTHIDVGDKHSFHLIPQNSNVHSVAKQKISKDILGKSHKQITEKPSDTSVRKEAKDQALLRPLIKQNSEQSQL
ncbi:galactose-3-O-sulfotransferase 2 [Triplophysa rosa]|uniref:Galactose-3-O-sulfotransferase 2-like n=1 Tax=Triplophysa rosa TaxID=992332 RepID=A0A9W7TKU0_TRIRA|nr:galactose-3-O-sulfotransferase 2 [Triplophysa rosa]XP_057207156.1 galactose-3-O-sulfotransferase 2 [Triplophysa rosa]KAI7800743.1 putative galactose-3-O-sulfotransferase 2-like [Triplophysa rosa]